MFDITDMELQRGGVFWSNGGGFSFWGGKKYCIQSFESAPLFSQKLKKKKYSTLNGAVLTNSYILGFSFDLEYVKVQFIP